MPPQTTPTNTSNQPEPLLTPSARKTKVITVIAIILALAALVTAAIVYSGNVALDKESEESAPVATVNIASGTGFDPSTIRIKKGQTVEWVNLDSSAHTIAPVQNETDNSSKFFETSSVIAAGERYSFTFDETGTFTYNDSNEPFETSGVVEIEN